MQKNTILLLLLIITCSSCIVGHSVSIINNTKVDQYIRVIYPSELKQKVMDTLQVYYIRTTANAITSRDYYRYSIKVPIEDHDHIKRTYSFLLKAGNSVLLENSYPNSTPGFGQLFILNGGDTILFAKKGGHFLKQPRWGKGGSWVFKIQNE